MGRFLIAGLLAVPVLAAAPVPKDTDAGRMARTYGATHDPDKGADFRPTGDTLRISVPLEQRLLAPYWKIANAPRVWREVRGTFVVTVKVSFPVRPTVPAKHEHPTESRAGGGLVLWLDDASYLTVTRDERESDGAPGEYCRSEWCHKGTVQCRADYAEPQKSGYLRVERWAKGFHCRYSRDGKKWTPLGSYSCEWGDTLRVGVVAENGFKAPFEVAFDEYTLTSTKE
jgi:regulation of enolase protein 1 (concanavalin A-like superfamily)